MKENIIIRKRKFISKEEAKKMWPSEQESDENRVLFTEVIKNIDEVEEK